MAKNAAVNSKAAPDLEREEKRLAEALEQERAGRTLSLGRVTKQMGAAQRIMAADPQVQVAFVRHIVAAYARMGTPKGKKIREWFRDKDVPSSGAEVVRQLLRRKLPFEDEMLAEMFEQMSQVSFLQLVEFRDALARALELRVKGGDISPRLRKAARRFADVLAVRHVSAKEREHWHDEWGFPAAADRKIASRIDRLVGGPT